MRVKLKSLSLLLIFYITPIVAQQWKSLGLEKEFISAIAVDSTNPEIIYAGSISDFSAGTVGGLFKTTNGGNTWDTLIRGVTVRDLDIHPINPKIIYATLGINALTQPGIIKSTDGGNIWNKADTGIITNWERGGSVLIINPIHPDTLYAGTGGPMGGNLYISTNGGNSWSNLNSPTLSSITSIAIDPKNTSHIYIGTDDTGKIYETNDAGNNWIITGLTDKGIIYDIQFDPDSSGKIYAGTSRYGFFISRDSGKTWQKNNKGLQEPIIVRKIQFLSENKNHKIFISTSDSLGIYYLNDNSEWINYGEIGSSSIYIIKQRIYAVTFYGIFVNEILTSVSNNLYFPTSIQLYQNYPNPFNGNTNIEYKINGEEEILINIYDILGKKIKTLIQDRKTSGQYIANWDGTNDQDNVVSSGLYICILKANKCLYKLKMLYIK